MVWCRSGVTEITGCGEYERRLLVMCNGNKEQVWRLIMYERRRKPGITREEAVRHAIESWRRDQERSR